MAALPPPLDEHEGRETLAIMQSIALMLQLAARNLLRQRRRTLIATSTVGCGVMFLAMAAGFMEWMFLDFREAMIRSQYAHLQISRPGFNAEGYADPNRYLMPSDEQIAAVSGLPEIQRITPRVSVTGLISKQDSTLAFIAEGVDPDQDLQGDRGLHLIEGTALRGNTGRSILLGRGLARLLGARVGDKVVLMVNTPSGGVGAAECVVQGIFVSVSASQDESAALLPLRVAQDLLKLKGSHRWMVYLHHTEATAAAEAKLEALLPSSEYEVLRWDELAEFYHRAVALLRDQLGVVRVIVILIILLGIANTMTMSAMERLGEFGTSMALGYSRKAVLRNLLCEGALIGLAGGFLGLMAVWIVGAGVSALHIELPPPPGLSRGYLANVLLTPRIVAESLLLALVTTTLACVYPAWKVTRMPIVDALRHGR